MIKEFKNFILTGNVMDLAVGVILGAAVGAVVNGFVADIAMPFVGYLTGGADFSSLKFVLSEAVLGADGKEVTAENAIRYGAWVNTLINLVMVGLVLFVIIKAYNKARKPAEVAAPAGPSEVDLLTEIRDALKK
jgi:large conductance mechanosensitive channel